LAVAGDKRVEGAGELLDPGQRRAAVKRAGSWDFPNTARGRRWNRQGQPWRLKGWGRSARMCQLAPEPR
jgi:hypothetical protein